VISLHTRVCIFLQVLSHRLGNKICKHCGIDIENAKTMARIWMDMRHEALQICTKDDSQMSKL